jgi:uncharacterized membrane-anchored protein YjiN (DUF445 family)
MEAATVLHGELQQFLDDLGDTNHPVRRWIHARLIAAAESLEKDPSWAASIHAWQQGMASRLDLEAALTTLAALVLSGIGQPAHWIAAQSEKLLDTFQTDPVLQDWTEERLKAALSQFIDVEHNLVSTVVKEALERLSDRDLNRFIEDKAGEDLAWIRINGSVVGGLVGLMLFLFLHYVYDPVLIPLVRTWWQ